jgi:hypothetical protein
MTMDVLQDPSAFFFRYSPVQQESSHSQLFYRLVFQESTIFLELLNPKDEGTIILQNGGNYSPIYIASYPRKLASSHQLT